MSLPVRYTAEAFNGTWRINVGGRVYGPYTGHQLKAFSDEGRIAPHSIVQAGETGPWITAIDDPILGQLFVREGARQAAPAAPNSGVGAPELAAASARVEKSATAANFVIVTDLKGTGTGQLQTAINRLGDNYRVTPSVWLLRSELPAGTIRNQLTPMLGRYDSLFVVDTTQNRTAWFNLGPDADAHIRKIWVRDADKAH
jgi:hypothetical protein